MKFELPVFYNSESKNQNSFVNNPYNAVSENSETNNQESNVLTMELEFPVVYNTVPKNENYPVIKSVNKPYSAVLEKSKNYKEATTKLNILEPHASTTNEEPTAIETEVTTNNIEEDHPIESKQARIDERPVDTLVEQNSHKITYSLQNDMLQYEAPTNDAGTSYNSADPTPRIKSMDLQHAVFYPNHTTTPKQSAPPPPSADKTDNRERPDDDNTAKMCRAEERLKTFSNWPVSFLKPETLVDNGFYYLNRGDEVRCAFCKVEIMRWEPGDDPAADHRKWAPQCPFLRQAGTPAPARGKDECGSRNAAVRMPGPANPNYAVLAARIRSFEHWPLSLRLRQTPLDLAEAGFFYTGTGDQTKCFYCDGGLKDWEDDDVPWEQHARWFNRCAYVQLVKGREYVQRVMTEASVVPSPAPVETPAPVEVDTTATPTPPAVEDEKICKICYGEERNVCFVPCGHVVACAKCALATTKCPMCRKTFTDAIRIYFA